MASARCLWQARIFCDFPKNSWAFRRTSHVMKCRLYDLVTRAAEGLDWELSDRYSRTRRAWSMRSAEASSMGPYRSTRSLQSTRDEVSRPKKVQPTRFNNRDRQRTHRSKYTVLLQGGLDQLIVAQHTWNQRDKTRSEHSRSDLCQNALRVAHDQTADLRRAEHPKEPVQHDRSAIRWSTQRKRAQS